MKIVTQHYQERVSTSYENNRRREKEKIDISPKKDDAVTLEISTKGKNAIHLKDKKDPL